MAMDCSVWQGIMQCRRQAPLCWRALGGISSSSRMGPPSWPPPANLTWKPRIMLPQGAQGLAGGEQGGAGVPRQQQGKQGARLPQKARERCVGLHHRRRAPEQRRSFESHLPCSLPLSQALPARLS